MTSEHASTNAPLKPARRSLLRTLFTVVAVAAFSVGCVAVVVVAIQAMSNEGEAEQASRPQMAVPIEAADIERRDIRDIRALSGTLQARSRSMIASRVSGRILDMRVNIGDAVESGDVVATLDAAEYEQSVEESRADLRVAEATLAENQSMLAIAERNLDRIRRLFEEQIASESEYDAAHADYEAKGARVRVSESQVARAEAQLRAAEVRLSYATIRAVWPEPQHPRIIGERFVDAGSTIAANEPIISLLDIDTLLAVVYVSERDYARLRVGQSVRVVSDSNPDEVFTGAIVRLAPEFREASRQARVEIELQNADHRLKPGMFVRAEVELDRIENATVIPREAISRRRDVPGAFLVDEDEMTVRFVPLRIGVSEAGMVQVLEPELTGRVVTLGQHLLEDGTAVRYARPIE